jgi:hypothetical protein
MIKKILISFAAATLFYPASTAQAQSIPALNAVNSVILARKFIRGEFADRTVTPISYRGQQFPMQRAIPEKLSGPGADQITFLEALLEKCHLTMFSDSSAAVCPASQLTTIKATQAIVAKVRPLWSQKNYRDEIAFYMAEDARRQRAMASAALAK